MENRVFILFFVIVFLSFLFTASSACVLHERKKHALKIPPIAWILLFFAITIPLTFGLEFFEIQLFKDYTQGLRIEFHGLFFQNGDGNSYLFDIYINKKILDIIRQVLYFSVMLWISCTAAFLSFGMSSYFNSLHFLTKHSSACHDDKINKIFLQAKRTAGIRRNVVLRVVKSDIKISPCTCGTVFPTVFVGKDYLYGYSETRLKLIFLHELMHIKQYHSFLKLLTLGITSLFGLIPFAKRIRKAVIEDCEYICDRKVMAFMGEDMIAEYMSMIIDIAEQNVKYKSNDALVSPASEAGEMIMKRYGSMKSDYCKWNNFRYILPVILTTVILNMLGMSSVAIKSIDNIGVDIASPIIERSLCEYFGVTDPHDLKESHIAAVYSIEFCLSKEIEMIDRTNDERYALSVIINEGLVYNGNGCVPFPGYPDEAKFICGIVPQIVRADMFASVFSDDTDAVSRFSSCYKSLKYAGEDEVEVLILDGVDHDTVREYLLYEYENGKLDDFLIASKIVDTRDILLFDNLRTIIFSDKLKSSVEDLYSGADFAIINRK